MLYYNITSRRGQKLVDPMQTSTAIEMRLDSRASGQASKLDATAESVLRLPCFMAERSTPVVLQEALRSGISIAIWQRKLLPVVHDGMAMLYVLMPLQRMFTLGADEDAAQTLDHALVGFGQLPESSAKAWRDDLLLLIALARGLAPQAVVRVRIETKVNDACRLFHADNVPLRMICAYRGPGTQWLPEGTFDRAELGRGSNNLVRDWSAMRQLATGDVAVMKGLRFPGTCADALVHRSPPADATQPRVVAVIDILL